jgi:hypothetical protein
MACFTASAALAFSSFLTSLITLFASAIYCSAKTCSLSIASYTAACVPFSAFSRAFFKPAIYSFKASDFSFMSFTQVFTACSSLAFYPLITSKRNT